MNPEGFTYESVNLRCSRPLCSSQNTGGTHCAWTDPVTQESEDRLHPSDANGPEVSVPLEHFEKRPSGSGPSGPNSVQKTRLRCTHRSNPRT